MRGEIGKGGKNEDFILLLSLTATIIIIMVWSENVLFIDR